MPSSIRFVLKDSHPLIVEHAPKKELKGRHYDPELAKGPGHFKATELLYGLQMACLSITDDKPNTLKNVGKMNPWQIESVKMITGSVEKAHQPLSQILKSQFNLDLDHHIDVSGLTKAGHALDTQGFIAHNDTTIVLSYRCTTSASDWITNFTTTSSAFEIEEDLAQGHSGFWSCLSGCCGLGEDAYKPRVHTGFYNNFLATVPAIRQYIDPLLQPVEPPRTLYVVGHSLGAGIAMIAACYFVLENYYDWENSPHKLRIVTAGGPRSIGKNMCELMDTKLRALRPTDQVLFARCVRDKDAVAKLPPTIFGFDHISEKLVYLTKPMDGVSDVLINPDMSNVLPKRTLLNLLDEHPEILGEDKTKDDLKRAKLAATLTLDDDDDDDDDKVDFLPKPSASSPAQRADVTYAASDEVDTKIQSSNLPTSPDKGDDGASKYKMIPRNLRDHMPEFYLKPLYQICDAEREEQQLYAYENYNTSRDSSVEETGNKPARKNFFRRRPKK